MKTMRNDYAPHGCHICGATTTRRNYCDKHLRLIIPPTYSRLDGMWIDAEAEPSPRWRRKENIDQLR